MQQKTYHATTSRLRSRGKKADGQPNQIDIHIGNRISLRRQILKLSQEQLATRLGLSFQQIQKYEKTQNRVSGSRLYDFACLLGVDVNFFYMDMPEDIRRQSPRYIAAPAPLPAEIKDQIATLNDPMKSEQILNIIRAFINIKNQKLADNVYQLIQLLGSSSYMLNKDNQADC